MDMKCLFPPPGKALGIALVAVIAVAVVVGVGLLPPLVAPVTYATNYVKSFFSSTKPTA